MSYQRKQQTKMKHFDNSDGINKRAKKKVTKFKKYVEKQYKKYKINNLDVEFQ